MKEAGAQAVHITAEISGFSFEQFRRQIIRRAIDFSACLTFFKAGETEIDDFCLAVVVDENVGGLDIAVDQAGPTGGFEAARGIDHDFKETSFITGRILEHHLIDAPAGHQFHDDIRLALLHADRMDLHDVAMIQCREIAGFAHKVAHRIFISSHLMTEHFDRDMPAKRDVLGLEDLAHRAVAQSFQKKELAQANGDGKCSFALGTGSGR